MDFKIDYKIFTGKVFDYTNSGHPLVKLGTLDISIRGYSTALKPSIDEKVDYFLSGSSNGRDINQGMTIKDTPSDTLGTIVGFSPLGGPVMTINARAMFVNGYSAPLGVGDVTGYKKVYVGDTFDTVWIVEDQYAIERALGKLACICDDVTFGNVLTKRSFLNSLRNISYNYYNGHDNLVLKKIHHLRKDLIKNPVRMDKFADNKYELLNGLKFLKLAISENHSK